MAEHLVNWSIRLTEAEADQWDDLVYALRKETGHRTLSKADIVRALLNMTKSKTVRDTLIRTLT